MMKWTVLSDNRAKDPSFMTEHGLSILLETERYRILLDTGASDVFILNAKRMGIDLGSVDYVFISHGHSDHAGGLRHFMDVNKRAKVIVSPEAVNGMFYSRRNDLHSITTMWPEGMGERLIMVDHTCEVADGIHIMAHIPHTHPMPKGNRHLFIKDLAQRLTDNYPQTVFHTSHCTGDIAYAIMKKAMADRLHAFCCGTTRKMEEAEGTLDELR